jgi:hypothetical protein
MLTREQPVANQELHQRRLRIDRVPLAGASAVAASKTEAA